MSWRCPLCGADRSFFRDNMSDMFWADGPGSATSVCKKCAKDRKEEIDEHNQMMGQGTGGRHTKDPDCEHNWAHPFPSRWTCTKCGAEYNQMCGCGGSLYMCQGHHAKAVAHMKEEEGSVEAYLNKHSW